MSIWFGSVWALECMGRKKKRDITCRWTAIGRLNNRNYVGVSEVNAKISK